jgi:hypothetical protein
METPTSDHNIPELHELQEAQERLQRFREAYPDVFEQYEHLATDYNNSLEAAEKIVRARALSVGPFELYQYAQTYNADQLYEELGHELFIQVGGVVETKATYRVDAHKLNAAIAAGIIPKESVEKVVKRTPRYHTPEKLVIR